MWSCGLDWTGPEKDTMTDCHGDGDEPLHPQKEEIFWLAE